MYRNIQIRSVYNDSGVLVRHANISCYGLGTRITRHLSSVTAVKTSCNSSQSVSPSSQQSNKVDEVITKGNNVGLYGLKGLRNRRPCHCAAAAETAIAGRRLLNPIENCSWMTTGNYQADAVPTRVLQPRVDGKVAEPYTAPVSVPVTVPEWFRSNWVTQPGLEWGLLNLILSESVGNRWWNSQH